MTAASTTTPETALDATLALYDQASQERLVALAAARIPGTLVVLEGPGDLAERAGRWLAPQAFIEPGNASFDVHICTPDGDRWTVAELDEQVALPAQLAVAERAVIVVASGDQMDTAAAEHLLRTLEEPAAATLFIFCVRDAHRLLATIRGRAQYMVSLRPAEAARRAAILAETGYELDDAMAIVTWCGTETALAASILAAGHLEAAKHAFGLSADRAATKPATAARRIDSALDVLASDKQTKGRKRELCRLVLDRYLERLRAQIVEASPEAYQRIVADVQLLEDAQADLSANTAVVHVLAGLFASWQAVAPRA